MEEKRLPKWPRLDVYVPNQQVRRRIKLAATKRDMRVSQYCLEAILERVEEDEVLEKEATKAARGEEEETTVEELRNWQETVRTKLGGRPLPDSADLLRRLREKRTREIAGLC